jgi:hypothetical protein
VNEYQRLYERLFSLIMARRPGEPEPPECDEIRRRMDALPGGNAQKTAWGVEVGHVLYRKAVYGNG